jgi:hypothetical protein
MNSSYHPEDGRTIGPLDPEYPGILYQYTNTQGKKGTSFSKERAVALKNVYCVHKKEGTKDEAYKYVSNG